MPPQSRITGGSSLAPNLRSVNHICICTNKIFWDFSPQKWFKMAQLLEPVFEALNAPPKNPERSARR
jgi:hypothetical protein